MRPTFLSFQTAARALAASQAAIDVTGNNISNVNTVGYSRQRVDLNAITSSGYTERYSSSRTFVDAGVEASGISQIRDPFLDARYRKENAQNSRYNSLLGGLSDLENIIDEASVEKLQGEFTNFITQLNSLFKDATSQDLKLVTRTAAQKITEYFNTQAKQIEELRSQQIEDLTDVTVAKDFNSIVQNIASLNKQIRTEELYGNKPNDLYDARNNLLDQLSSIANIKVSVSSERVSDEKTVSHMTVSLYDANTGVSIGLVDADKYNTLAVHSDGGPVTISLNSSFMLDDASSGVDPTNITKYFTGGSISASLDLINGNGVYANLTPGVTGESSFRGTLYYANALDTLAAKFADVFNKLNDIGGSDGTPNTDTETPLFSSGVSGGTITAKNIQISQEWLDNPNYLNTTWTPDTTPGAGDNIERMIAAMSDKQNYYKTDGSLVFSGSFHQYAVGIIGELSLDVELNGNFADASDSVMENLYSSRESVSGVLSDEEGINLMTYQKSYNAAARYFTALDEAVDVLINKMGLVGR